MIVRLASDAPPRKRPPNRQTVLLYWARAETSTDPGLHGVGRMASAYIARVKWLKKRERTRKIDR